VLIITVLLKKLGIRATPFSR